MAMKISATKDGNSHLNKSSSGLFLGVVFVLLLIGILALSLWVSELSNASKNASIKVESRLAVLEEQLQLADSTSTEFLSDINSQLQFLDKEIRKLWDLSNKRNKTNISKLNDELKKHSEALKEIAATQTNDQSNINAIQKQSQKLKILVDDLSQANQLNLVTQNKIAELNKSILLLEETVQAFDSYRSQNNEMLQELQLQISSIKTVPDKNN
jgi:DNA repair exonuclease SbcCD ATPase subunit